MTPHEEKINKILKDHHRLMFISNIIYPLVLIICFSAAVTLCICNIEKTFTIMIVAYMFLVAILWDTNHKWLKERCNACVFAEMLRDRMMRSVSELVPNSEVKDENN